LKQIAPTDWAGSFDIQPLLPTLVVEFVFTGVYLHYTVPCTEVIEANDAIIGRATRFAFFRDFSDFPNCESFAIFVL
jgi:hypothetical protein